jgi:hypothetical protein
LCSDLKLQIHIPILAVGLLEAKTLVEGNGFLPGFSGLQHQTAQTNLFGFQDKPFQQPATHPLLIELVTAIHVREVI